jgi:guanosine-3',5'-bis(diphosphate) 3'-pyrophosphohydrolase
MLLGALRFAARRHRLQRRKDGESSPYINHPIEVAALLAHEGGVVETATLAAALLHDTVEDTGTQPGELEVLFGAEIRDLVLELTDDKTLEKSERKRLQIHRAPRLSPRAKAVKIADKISNVRDVIANPPAGWPLERRWAYLDWAERVVEGCRGANPGLEEVFDDLLRAGREVLRRESVTGVAGG